MGSVWIFLARGSLALKTQINRVGFPWISFSRPNPDLSMGYTGFSLKNFFASLLPRGPRSGGGKGRREGYAEAQKGS